MQMDVCMCSAAKDSEMGDRRFVASVGLIGGKILAKCLRREVVYDVGCM